MLTVEQVVAAQKSSLGNVFGATARTFEGFEKLVGLNLKASKATLADAAESAQAVLAIKDAQDFAALQGAVQPAVEKLAAYGREAYEIVSATRADIGKIASDGAAEVQQAFAGLFEVAVKNAPAGTEEAVGFVKSAVAAVNSAYETLQKTVNQAAEVAEANVEAVTASAAKVAGSRPKRAA